MIIAVQGSKKKKNNNIGTTALLASLTSILYNAKTLVLQVTNKKNLLVNDVLDKDHNLYNSEADSYEFNTTGLDALLMECTDVKELKKGLIEEKSETFIKSNGEPLLSVTRSSENKEFEEVTVDDFANLGVLLDSANEEYEYVFVLMPRDARLVAQILPKAQYNIICIPQSEKADIITFNTDIVKKNMSDDDNMTHKDIYLIADYDEESRYTQKKIRSDYNVKKTFVCYHNIDYKDAYNSHDILSFVKSNINVDEYDTNFMFITEIKRLIAEFALEELDEHYEDLTFVGDALFQYTPEALKKELESLSNLECNITEQKKHKFGKKKKTVIEIKEKLE